MDETPSPLKARLRELLDRRGFSERGASIAANLSPTYVSDIFNGKNSRPSTESLQRLAKVFDSPLAYLMGDVDYASPEFNPVPTHEMPFLGFAETGAFRSMPIQSTVSLVHRPLSKGYPEAKHFALGIADDSMNAADGGPMFKGMEVLCIDMIDADLVVESKGIYAVRRTLDKGRTWETLIRRAKVYRERTELLAETTRMGYEKIIIEGPLSTDQAALIFAVGRVYGVYHSVE